MVRKWIANVAMGSARSFGKMIGCELVVEVSDHSIETSMERPGTSERAWDPNLYHRGQLFIDGYANPVKPVAGHDPESAGVDSVDIEESDVTESGGDSDGVGIIPSWRYKQLMEQELLSQLINPSEQWRKIVYGMIGLGALQFVTMIIILYATGSF